MVNEVATFVSARDKVRAITVAMVSSAALLLPQPIAAATTVIPEPSGPYKVGARDVEYIDASRTQPYATGSRKFMARVWYPSNYTTSTAMKYSSQNFLNEWRMSGTIASGLSDSGMSANISGKYNHAGYNVSAYMPSGSPMPVVIYSPGFGLPRILESALAQDLASFGYVVIVLGHSRESLVEEHPSGLIGQYAAPINDVYKHWSLDTRIADIGYVLNRQIAGLPAIIDWLHVAAIGHSLGSAAVLQRASTDTRIGTVVMLDGIAGWDYSTGTVVPSGLPCDVLCLSTVPGTVGGAGQSHPSVQQMLAGGDNGHTMISAEVSGTQHLAFTDVASIVSAAKAPAYRGTIAAARIHQIVRTYVRGWLDYILLGAPMPAYIVGNTGAYPEVDVTLP